MFTSILMTIHTESPQIYEEKKSIQNGKISTEEYNANNGKHFQ